MLCSSTSCSNPLAIAAAIDAYRTADRGIRNSLWWFDTCILLVLNTSQLNHSMKLSYDVINACLDRRKSIPWVFGVWYFGYELPLGVQ